MSYNGGPDHRVPPAAVSSFKLLRSTWQCLPCRRAPSLFPPQAFKFVTYVALPIGLTAAVVLRQDILQAIIKSVRGLLRTLIIPHCCVTCKRLITTCREANRAACRPPAHRPLCLPFALLQRSYVVYPPSDVTDEKIQDVRAARGLQAACRGCCRRVVAGAGGARQQYWQLTGGWAACLLFVTLRLPIPLSSPGIRHSAGPYNTLEAVCCCLRHTTACLPACCMPTRLAGPLLPTAHPVLTLPTPFCAFSCSPAAAPKGGACPQVLSALLASRPAQGQAGTAAALGSI